MKMATTLIGHVIEMDENYISSVVIENTKLFREFVTGLYMTIEQGDSTFVFSEDGKTIKPSDSISIIQTFVPFTINTKPLQMALIKALGKYAVDNSCLDRTTYILSEVSQYINELSLDMPYGVTVDDLSPTTLFKFAGVAFEEDDLTLVDKVLAYMRLSRDLLKRRVFILIHARSYFSVEEIRQLSAMCIIEKILLLLVDSEAKEMLERENCLVIDRDLCELTHMDDSLV